MVTLRETQNPTVAARTRAASTYDTVITHVRRAPLPNRFTYESRCWLVDLDELPRLPAGLRWLASFEARDHLGDPSRSLRANLERFLAVRRIDVRDGQIRMLANPRGLGHAFNPISIFWAYSASGAVAAVIVEVHNTYGDRHAYLLLPDADGRVDVQLDKAMYVSPFNPVDGRYRISVSEPGERISVSVRLDRSGHPPFVAMLTGQRRVTASPLGSAVGSAATSIRVSSLIRWQGVRLYLRGLPVQPRPAHAAQEGVR